MGFGDVLMGLLKSCYATSESSGSVERAMLALYDQSLARVPTATNPGFDDLLGEPLYEDFDDDGVGERIRPETVVEIKAKAKWTQAEEQLQDGTGNAPGSRLKLTVFEENLKALGLLVDGVCSIRPNDRLLRLQDSQGRIRYNFEESGRDGLHCYEVRPGETGTGVLFLFFENRRIIGPNR